MKKVISEKDYLHAASKIDEYQKRIAYHRATIKAFIMQEQKKLKQHKQRIYLPHPQELV